MLRLITPSLALLCCLNLVACDRMAGFAYDRAAEQLAQGDRSDWLGDGALHVILCGTGTPVADAERAGPCTAIIANGQFYLVDVGPGSWENVQLWRLPRAQLSGVLLTHFHSDHIGELGEATLQSWVAGRTGALEVFGPEGVVQVAGGFRAAYSLDARYRIDHHGSEAMPYEGSVLVARPVELPAPDESAVVIDRDGVRITAFAVDHAPVAPAYGYRVEYNGRAVVISGDTGKSSNLAKHAAGADILVHEALARAIIKPVSRRLKHMGEKRLAKLTADIQDYHASPVEAAELAAGAKVDMLIFTHMVPAPNNALLRRLFLRGVDDAFGGEVVIGADGMHFRLPGGSQGIEQAMASDP